MVRLDEDVYERIRAEKREDETFSEAVDRMTSGYTLLDFAGGWDEDDVEEFRKLQERAEEKTRDERAAMMERLDDAR